MSLPDIDTISSILTKIIFDRPEIIKRFGVVPINSDISLSKGLGFDSIAFLEYIMATEDAFNITFDYSVITLEMIDSIPRFAECIAVHLEGHP